MISSMVSEVVTRSLAAKLIRCSLMKFFGGDRFNCSNLRYKLWMLICKLLASSWGVNSLLLMFSAIIRIAFSISSLSSRSTNCPDINSKALADVE